MKETTGEREAQNGGTGGGGGGIKGAAAVAAKGQKMSVFTMSTKHNTGAQEYRSSLGRCFMRRGGGWMHFSLQPANRRR